MVCTLLLQALSLWAEPSPPFFAPLQLDEALRMALKHSPEIKKTNAALADKLAAATDIQLPPNPELQVEARVDDSKAGDLHLTPAYETQLTQTFRLSHFGMRQVYAAALKHSANLEQQADVLRVLNETVLLYYRLWMLQKREKVLASSEKEARQVIARIEQALARQEMPLTEGSLFKADAIRFGVELKATQAERMQAQADLIAALGCPWQEVTLTAPRLEPIPSDRFQLTQFAQGRANLQRLVEQKQRAAARRYDVARMDIFPELSLRGIYDRSDDGKEAAWGAGLVVRIPIWDWNQGEVQRAKAGKEAADAEASVIDRVTFDRIVEIRMKRASALQLRAEAYWNDVLPAYQKSYEIGRRLFDQGQANMLQLWQFQQQVTATSDKAMQDTVDALAARTLLEQTIGGKIEEIPRQK
jgi:cobalt-zinc-cadmium efflux system outer membrane protein